MAVMGRKDAPPPRVMVVDLGRRGEADVTVFSLHDLDGKVTYRTTTNAGAACVERVKRLAREWNVRPDHVYLDATRRPGDNHPDDAGPTVAEVSRVSLNAALHADGFLCRWGPAPDLVQVSEGGWPWRIAGLMACWAVVAWVSIGWLFGWWPW